jgi:hypothetical protein
VNFLIPANTKKSLLFFGLFNRFDLILFGSGIGISLLLLMVLPIESLKWAIIAIAPGLVTGFLVFPIPYYHNVLTVIKNVITFFTTRQEFVWKGWCVRDGEEDSDK